MNNRPYSADKTAQLNQLCAEYRELRFEMLGCEACLARLADPAFVEGTPESVLQLAREGWELLLLNARLRLARLDAMNAVTSGTPTAEERLREDFRKDLLRADALRRYVLDLIKHEGSQS